MHKLLYKTAAIKQIEQAALSQGITESQLMERAGEAALQHLRTVWPAARRLTVFCGGGNNGGDGFVLARLAKQANLDVKVIVLGSDAKQSLTAQHMQQTCQQTGVNMVAFDAAAQFNDTDVVVDAMLGTGLARPLKGKLHDAVLLINRLQLPVLALDVPTGINADTGDMMGVAVNAQQTLTFIALKAGLVTGAALDYIGNLSLATLGVTWDVHKPAPVANSYNAVADILPKRARNSHKGMFGHVVIVGGNHGMAGAPRMTAAAALRAGAGRVTLLTRPEYAPMANIALPELMCAGVNTVADMPESIDSATVWAIGPGLGHDRWAINLLRYVLRQQTPIIVDADALRWLAAHQSKQDNWILTPHPGEAAALLGVETRDIQKDRLKAAIALQRQYGGVAVLKGAGTIITAEKELPAVCVNTGNAGMASAGMGDSLAGIIAALVAQHLPLYGAATSGVWLHARAGDLAAATAGERGLLASDLLPYVQKLINGYSV